MPSRMSRVAGLVGGVCLVITFFGPTTLPVRGQVVTFDFTDDFAPANWSVFNDGDGTADFSLDQTTLTMVSSDDGVTDFAVGSVGITIPYNGNLQFNFLGTTADADGWACGCGDPIDFVGYSVNFGPNLLSPDFPSFDPVSGTVTVPLLAGDFFEFNVGSIDSLQGPATFTVDGFSFTAVPEPEEYALGAGGLLLGFAVWRRRRQCPVA
jgi:hypothetical protein